MLKNRRAVSLISTVITVVVMMIIMGTLTYSAIDSINIRKLNKLQNDLRQISDAVEIYYLKNGKLPVDMNRGSITIGDNMMRSDLEVLGMEFLLKKDVDMVVDQNSFYNPNDYETGESMGVATYQFLKLSLLDNISLNYKNSDYIINTKSHTVYNLTGVPISGAKYHTLSLNYVDTRYKENHIVNQIRLREIEGVTNSTNNDIYFAYSNQSLNLRDYLIFDFIGNDGLGEPKTLRFTLTSGQSNYFTLNETTGVLTRKDYGNDVGNLDYTSEILVKATSYGVNEEKTITLRVHMASINVYDVHNIANPILLESVNLACNQTEYIHQNAKISTANLPYTIQRNGILNTNDVDIDVTSQDISIAWATYDRATKKVVFQSGQSPGRTTITFRTRAYGLAKDTVTVDVYDYGIYENDDEDKKITELNFSGVGSHEAKEIYLKVNGPEDVDLGADDVTWTEMRYNQNTREYVESSSGMIDLDLYSNGNYRKVTVIPTNMPENDEMTYLRCQYKFAGEDFGELIIPIHILGSIQKYDTSGYSNISDDTINFSMTYDSAQLKYVFSSVPVGNITYTASSSNLDFQFENEDSVAVNSTGEFTVTYIGTSSETTTELTITATVINGSIRKEYTDTVTIQVSSF